MCGTMLYGLSISLSIFFFFFFFLSTTLNIHLLCIFFSFNQQKVLLVSLLPGAVDLIGVTRRLLRASLNRACLSGEMTQGFCVLGDAGIIVESEALSSSSLLLSLKTRNTQRLIAQVILQNKAVTFS